MTSWRNLTGRPLSSKDWLEVHHKAKIEERTKFVDNIKKMNPRRIVDLGCGVGLWLELIAKNISGNCEFIGFDSDPEAIEEAKSRFYGLGIEASFDVMDMESHAELIPESDTYLAFNIFPYIKKPDIILNKIHNKIDCGGRLIVRQYDGGLLRYGPQFQKDRSEIESSIESSTLSSDQFRHYDLDNVFSILSNSQFSSKFFDFEVFKRFSPYSDEVRNYILGTTEWEKSISSDVAYTKISSWVEDHISENTRPSYFMCIDLIAYLSK